MAAITRSAPSRAPGAPARPELRLVIGGAHPRHRVHRLHPSVYRRRRLVALLLAVTVVVLASTLASAIAGWAATPPGRAAATGTTAGPASATHVVQAGDTLWSVARELQPNGDVRPLVDALADANGGTVLRPGEVLAVP